MSFSIERGIPPDDGMENPCPGELTGKRVSMDLIPSRPVPLTVIWLSNHPEDRARTCCPTCQRILDIHAEEGARAGRWLGTCAACGACYTLEHVPDGEGRGATWNGGSCPESLAN